MNDGKFLTIESGRTKQELGINISAGVGDASKLARLDATGKWDLSMMPVGVGPDTKIIQASENLANGDFINVWDDAGTTKVRKADATAMGKECDGFVLTAVPSGNNVTVYLEGTNNQLSGLTGGIRYYLSASVPGGTTSTPPSASGNVVQYLGKATSSTELSFEADEGVILA